MAIFVARKTVTIVNKASPQGPGAGVLQTEYPLLSVLGKQSDQKKMEHAWKLGISVPWIRAAERVIGGAFVNVPWHLEDENEEEITEGDAYDLIASPQLNTGLGKKMTRSDLWRLTCRHMGLCGNAFWYLDGINTFGQPSAILYLRPDRMTPVDDSAGNLIGWLIDKTPTSPGIGVRLEQIVQFMLEPPDVGHFGIGLVESALLKASLSTALDQHLAQILSAGGHLSGIMSPKTGQMGTEQMVSLERDWRSVVEQSDPAKRLQLVAAPVDFTPTVMSPDELALVELMNVERDSLLGLWGVPLSKLGIHDRGRGLQGGTMVAEDDATLWQEGVKPRMGGQDEGGFTESVQQLLDRFAETNGVTELIIDEPTFDDDAPKFTNAAAALNLPLRNRERRDILGYEPFGEKVINPETGIPIDDEVWLPLNQVRAYLAPEDGRAIPMPEAPAPVETDSAGRAAGETTAAPVLSLVKATVPDRVKPLHDSLTKLRSNIDTRMTPKVKSNVRAFLDEQRRDIASRIRRHADHLTHDPSDSSVWFPARQYDQKLIAALGPTLSVVATDVSQHVNAVLGEPMKADPVERVLIRGAARITKINETTRTKVQALIAQGLEDGLTMLQVADSIEAGIPVFDDYRAELIARTEIMDAYNSAAIGSYRDAGMTEVQAIDGDKDEECANRDGRIFSIADADSIEDHPNGTLDWVPVLPGMASLSVDDLKGAAMSGAMSPVIAAMLKAAIDYAERPMPDPVINVAAPQVNVEAPVVINNMPEQPAPLVTVEASKAEPVQMPDIIVNVPAQEPPIVNVNIPEERGKRVVYKGDKVDRVEPI